MLKTPGIPASGRIDALAFCWQTSAHRRRRQILATRAVFRRRVLAHHGVKTGRRRRPAEGAHLLLAKPGMLM